MKSILHKPASCKYNILTKNVNCREFICDSKFLADFCVLTAVGVFMDYFYQITFFCSCMVYGGMREEEGGLSAYFKRQPFKITLKKIFFLKTYWQKRVFGKGSIAKK